MTPVWRLNACSIFSTSAAIASEMSRASGGDLVDMAGQRAVDILAGLGELAEIVFQRAGQHVAAFGQLADMAGNDVVDLAAAFGELLQVGFQRALENVAALGQLLDLAGNQPVDARAALGELGEVVFQSARKGGAILGQPLHLMLDETIDALQVGFQRARKLRAVLDQLVGLLGNDGADRVEVGFERAREDIAALGELFDLAGDQPVDAGAALGQPGEVVFERLRQGGALLRQPVHMRGDRAPDIVEVAFQRLGEARAVARQLFGLVGDHAADRGKIGLQRALENVAAFGQLLDLAGDQAVDARAALGQLGEVVFQRPRKRGAFLDQPFRMACDHAADGVEVDLERAPENVAAFGQLLDLTGNEPVDARTAVGQLGEIVFQSVRQGGPFLFQPVRCARRPHRCTCSRSPSSACANCARSLDQLLGLVGDGVADRVEVGFERALENVAAFGKLLDLAGDQSVDAGAALGQLGEIVFQRLRQGSSDLAPAWLMCSATDAV